MPVQFLEQGPLELGVLRRTFLHITGFVKGGGEVVVNLHTIGYLGRLLVGEPGIGEGFEP